MSNRVEVSFLFVFWADHPPAFRYLAFHTAQFLPCLWRNEVFNPTYSVFFSQPGRRSTGQNCIPYPHDPTVAFWHMGDVVRVSHSLVFYKWFMVLCWFIILFFFLAWCQQSRLWGVLQTGRLRLDTSGLRLRGVQHLRVPTLPIPAWLLECGKFIFFSVHTSRPFMTVILFSLLELPSTVFWHLNH